MANQLFCSFLALMLLTSSNYHTTSIVEADQICGKWQNEDKNLVVQVYRDNAEYKARIVWFDNGEGEQAMYNFTDKHNPDPALRNRKLLGMNVLENLVYDPETRTWEDGLIYDATNGRQWSSSAKINKDGSLKVKGYWKFKFIGKTISFKRI